MRWMFTSASLCRWLQDMLCAILKSHSSSHISHVVEQAANQNPCYIVHDIHLPKLAYRHLCIVVRLELIKHLLEEVHCAGVLKKPDASTRILQLLSLALSDTHVLFHRSVSYVAEARTRATVLCKRCHNYAKGLARPSQKKVATRTKLSIYRDCTLCSL